MADTQKTETKPNPTPSKDPGWYRVISSFPEDRGRVLFRSVSETRARRYLTNRFPRGSEAHLQLPDGSYEHYEHERQGEHGQDAEQWGAFNPDDWKPPAMQEPPGQSAWGDVEG